ncbi:uncharacterized protein LOC111637209 [Centruroides sculpturatus]|uniref:uncharacterized protein LOC111637209 n=1 Tax=Centruroides sculpturatus TaxID=218467 RepID=UPI000C6D6B57|nr:uncharacterized protein LOC111637209 [Centruroides sculpturatus]
MLVFSWVKAHIGDQGNERADSLAKEASYLKTKESYREISTKDIKTKIKNRYILQWQQRREITTKGRELFEYIPDINQRLNKHLQIGHKFTRFVTGHGNFAKYHYRFNHRDDENCGICGQTKNQYKKTTLQARADSWRNKALHGQFLDKIEGKVDKERTWLWLTNGALKKETEGLIFAAQEQAIRTNAIKARIEKSADDPTCRLCKEADETIDHILSCCKKIAQTEYKQRHNSVAKMIHWNLCHNYHIPTGKNWWKHNPEKVVENECVKILWDFRIQTDKVLEHNTPDFTIVEKKKVWIIDVAIPGDSRIDEKQQEKLSRYQDLKIELQRLWHKPVQVVPVIIGALGAVPKDLSQHLQAINIDKITICQLQKATLLGSAHIIRRYITQS